MRRIQTHRPLAKMPNISFNIFNCGFWQNGKKKSQIAKRG
jgi:hypothetical protein